LKKDISESHNLVEEMPEKTASLKNQLHTWQKEIGALIPEKNPAFQ